VDLLPALVEAEVRHILHLLSLQELLCLRRFVSHYEDEFHVAAAAAQLHHERVYLAALLAVAGRVFHHHQPLLGGLERGIELLDAVDSLNSLFLFCFLGAGSRRGSGD